MASLDHIILKVNDLNTSVAFYTKVPGFTLEGTDGPFTIVRAGPKFQLQFAPWGTPGLEHYAFAVALLRNFEISPMLQFLGAAQIFELARLLTLESRLEIDAQPALNRTCCKRPVARECRHGPQVNV